MFNNDFKNLFNLKSVFKTVFRSVLLNVFLVKVSLLKKYF